MVLIVVVAAENVTVVGFAPAKVAVLVGIPVGDQLSEVFQSEAGPIQVAFCAWAAVAPSPRPAPAISAVLASNAVRRRARSIARGPRACESAVFRDAPLDWTFDTWPTPRR